MHKSHAHFKGKNAKEHLAEVKAHGIDMKTEAHGLETPGSYSSAADAARETVLLLTFMAIIGYFLNLTPLILLFSLIAQSLAFLIWKTGRSAMLAWSRLERLHRVLEQEKWEIEHHRPQEREELKELYSAKGFEGKLLEEVLDVLMADDSRLLKVMIEEELGYTLESYEHPLKQGFGAFLGVFFAAFFVIGSFYFFQHIGLFFAGLILVGLASGLSAYFAKNQILTSVVWSIGLFVLATSTLYFILDFYDV